MFAHEAACSKKEISMAHINFAELRWRKSQLKRQNLSRIYSKISIRLPFTTQSEGAGRLVVSSPSAVLLWMTLVLLCIVHSAHGSITPCIELPRAAVAVEHTIQVGGRKFSCHRVDQAPESYDSCSNSDESCWSCLDLNTATTRQPIFLQSASAQGGSQAIAGREVLGESSLAKFKGFYDQFRMRKLGPVNNNNAKEWQKKEAGPGVQQQHLKVVHIATVCNRDDPTSSSASFSRLILGKTNLQWRCNSTLAAQTTTGSGAAAASPIKDSNISKSTSSDLFVTMGTTSLSLNEMTEKRKRSPLLLRILAAVDGQIQASKCSDNGAQSVPAVVVDGRRTMARRVLLSGSWKSVIVVDSVIVGVGFFLSVSALSCWVLTRRALKADEGSLELPIIAPAPSTRRVSALGADSPGRGSPESGVSNMEEGSGRWSQVAGGGPGRWHWVEEEPLSRGSTLEDEDRARGPLVDTDDPGRESGGEEEGPGRGLLVEEEFLGRSSLFTEDGTGRDSGAEEKLGSRPRAEEGDSGREVQVLEKDPGRGLMVPEEGQGRGSQALDEGSTVRSSREETEAAHRSGQTVRYRAEPFCFRGLAAATGGFDERCSVGAGSFGTVYRGLLFDGRVVAIKRANCSNKYISDKERAFKAELDVMSRLHHKHLVNLVGYCDDCREMMLVYEYMPNGTLSDHLHNKRLKSQALSSWKARIRVALQAARGIEYLHTYADPPVIHRDIKSSNILLDANGSVRVSDFGLCLMFPSSSESEGEDEVQHITAKAAGTMGYMDPEYYHHQHLTTKSDVYSFGVVVLELLTGKRAIFRHNNSHISVVDYAVPAIAADELARIADPRVRVPTGHEFVAMKVMAEVGSQAVRLWGKDRPSMTEIVRRLEQAVILCRSRHAPLPVFGAQIGSSTDLSASPPACPSGEPFFLNNSAQLFDKFAGEGEEEEQDLDEGATGTNVAQLGSLSSSQARTLEVFLQDIYPNATDDDQFEHYPSDVDFQFYYSSEADSHDELLRCPPSACALDSEAVSNISGSSSLDPTAAIGYHGSGQAKTTHSSLSWQGTTEYQEMLLQDLRESRCDKFGKSGVLGMGTLPRTLQTGESYYSGEEYSAAASTIEILLGYYSSGKVVDDPLLNQGTTIMPGLASNFNALGPQQDINPQPPLPPPLLEQQEPKHLVPRPSGRQAGICEEHSFGPEQTAGGKKDQGGEFEGSAENCTSNVEVQEFLDDYTDEHVGSASYAGFSNFSVLHDLDELMKALHSLQEQRGQEDLEAGTPKGGAAAV